jgi:GNAT superfamily N-acetyltransferase
MGIGKLIVNKLIELCKENECDKIILNSNEKYLSFYENLGFKKKDFQMVIKL